MTCLRDESPKFLKNNAKYINLENLSGYDASEFILRNWGYNKIEQFTTYKAAMYGILTASTGKPVGF